MTDRNGSGSAEKWTSVSPCLEVLQWARGHGCPWDEMTCRAAVARGHLEVLKWAVEHGCPWWAGDICARAAMGGHLEVVQWAREHGFLWDESTCGAAARGGHVAGW